MSEAKGESLYGLTRFNNCEDNMWHIFGYNLSNAFKHLEEGNIDEAKKELEVISKDGYNINKELGQLITLCERFPGYIEGALNAIDIGNMKDEVTEAQIILHQIIKKCNIF